MTGRARYLALDIGGTWTRAALLRERSIRFIRLATAEPQTTMRDLLAFATCGGRMPDRVSLARAFDIDGGGLCADWPSRPDWQGFDIGRALAGLQMGALAPLHCDDGRAAAMAEARVAGTDDALAAVQFGTGLAIGISIRAEPMFLGDGSLVLAHSPVPASNALCRCGRRGCLQLYLAPAAGEPDRDRFCQALDLLVDRLRQHADCSAIVFGGGRLAQVRPLIEHWGRGAPRIEWRWSNIADCAPLLGAVAALNPRLRGEDLMRVSRTFRHDPPSG
ncbi:ROK family protein [Sphingomonas sp. DG1-23]|uniref:ROK family protein n=1 Tax=Sphingomonas sp. DG1-23 TaxID=3068316 RepID=UPI00353143CE